MCFLLFFRENCVKFLVSDICLWVVLVSYKTVTVIALVRVFGDHALK